MNEQCKVIWLVDKIQELRFDNFLLYRVIHVLAGSDSQLVREADTYGWTTSSVNSLRHAFRDVTLMDLGSITVT